MVAKKSTPRTFTGLARSGHKRNARNSGMFSNSGAGQKNDALPKVSPQGPGTRNGSKADVTCLKKAVHVPQKKNISGSGKSASKVQTYALNHGEKK